jgi:hypothetical protein
LSETAPVEEGYDIQHLSSVVLGALVVAVVATWFTSELARPLYVFPAAALLSGYLLNQRAGDREKLRLVGYTVVGLFVLWPALFFLPDIVAGKTVFLSQMMTVVVSRFLLLIAGIVGYVVYRLSGGAGVIERARDPDRRRGLAAYAVAAVLLLLPFVLFVLSLFAGTGDVEVLSVLLWRVLAVVAIAIAYGGYRADGGTGVVERVDSATAG